VVLGATAKERGDAARSTEPAAWAFFLDVDFSAGPEQVVLSVDAARAATLSLYPDTPIGGPRGRHCLAAAADPFRFTEVRVPVADLSHRHDLYAVLETTGAALARDDFS